MDKIAVYAVTPNCFEFLSVSIKSLLINSDVDKIHILIPKNVDDKACIEKINFKNVIIRNVDTEKYIDICSPNRFSMYTPMCLLRCAYHKLFPEYTTVLSLDYDVIVDDDISDIWDCTNLETWDEFNIAGVKEMGRCKQIVHGMFSGEDFVKMGNPYYEKEIYVNAGVMMMNLKRWRDTGIGDSMLYSVNHEEHLFPEQDVINQHSADKIYLLNGDYNACQFTLSTMTPKIVHYAGKEKNMEYSLVKKYKRWAWDKIAEHRQIKYGK